MSSLPAVVFDLDGTLVDTSLGILESLREAFKVTGMRPTFELDLSLIGPPLREMIATAAPVASSWQIAEVAKAFSEIYDNDGYRQLYVFPGISNFLNLLSARGFRLHLATNKRLRPTQQILSLLGWGQLFRSVWAIDSASPAFSSKAEMIAALKKSLRHASDRFIYVGDRFDDGQAATVENGVPFLHVAWGFEPPLKEADQRGWCVLNSPDLSCFEECLKNIGYRL